MKKTLDKQTLMRYNTQAVRERTPQLKKFVRNLKKVLDKWKKPC